MIFDGVELIQVASVIKPHGLKGHLSIKLIENFSEEIFEINKPVFLLFEGIPVPFFIQEIKNAANIVLKLQFIDSEEQAQKYSNIDILVKPEDLPITNKADSENEFADLEGFEVFDEIFGFIGKIILFNEIPGNIVFETEFKGKNIIIPWNEDIIKTIDYDNQKIIIVAPEGLIQLYLE
jgi:16S rRNA processing protein RimM